MEVRWDPHHPHHHYTTALQASMVLTLPFAAILVPTARAMIEPRANSALALAASRIVAARAAKLRVAGLVALLIGVMVMQSAHELTKWSSDHALWEHAG